MRVHFPASLILAASVFLAGPSPASAAPAEFDRGPVHVTLADAPKRLEFEVLVPAALPAVWTAFTTDSGLETWLAPSAHVVPEPGGPFLAVFAGSAPAGGTILAISPQAYLGVGAMAPGKFPHVRAERTYVLFTFASDGPERTRVHLTQTGWKDGAEWDDAYAYLAEGNAQLLNALYDRFKNGPIAWPKAAQ